MGRAPARASAGGDRRWAMLATIGLVAAIVVLYGYGSSSLPVLGQCSTIGTDDMVVTGADNDLVDCVACTQETAARGLTSFFSPLAQ